MANAAELSAIFVRLGLTDEMSGALQKRRAVIAAFSNYADRALRVGYGFLKDVLSAVREQDMAEANLASSLKATGGAAGLSAEQLKKMAAQMQEIGIFGDEAIMNAQAMLATFREIKGDNFKRATLAIADLAAKSGRDLKGMTVLIGRALNDPKVGLTYLARMVSISEAQRKYIYELVDSGNKAKAQAELLNILEKSYKGANEEMGKTPTGKIIQMTNAIGDMKEAIGTALAPVIVPLAKSFKEIAQSIGEWVTRNKEWIPTVVAVSAGLLGLVSVGGKIALMFITIKAAALASGVSVGVLAASFGAFALYAGGVLAIVAGLAYLAAKAQEAYDVVSLLEEALIRLHMIKREPINPIGALGQKDMKYFEDYYKKYKDVRNNLGKDLAQNNVFGEMRVSGLEELQRSVQAAAGKDPAEIAKRQLAATEKGNATMEQMLNELKAGGGGDFGVGF